MAGWVSTISHISIFSYNTNSHVSSKITPTFSPHSSFHFRLRLRWPFLPRRGYSFKFGGFLYFLGRLIVEGLLGRGFIGIVERHYYKGGSQSYNVALKNFVSPKERDVDIARKRSERKELSSMKVLSENASYDWKEVENGCCRQKPLWMSGEIAWRDPFNEVSLEAPSAVNSEGRKG